MFEVGTRECSVDFELNSKSLWTPNSVCCQEVSEWRHVQPQDMYLALVDRPGCEVPSAVLARLRESATHLDCSALKHCDFRALARVVVYLARSPGGGGGSASVHDTPLAGEGSLLSSCSFARNGLGDSFALAFRTCLGAAPGPLGLQALTLSGNCFTAKGVRAIAEAVRACMPHLQLLDLSYSWDASQAPMTQEQSLDCAQALASGGLTSLDMSGCAMSVQQLLALPVAVMRLSGTLRCLRLDHNPQSSAQAVAAFAEGLAAAVRARGEAPTLHGLSLHGLAPSASPSWCTAVRGALGIAHMRVLNLSCTDLGDDGARVVTDALRPLSAPTAPHLQSLLLECCNIARRGFCDLANALCPPRRHRRRLTSLSLHGNMLGQCSAAELSVLLCRADCPLYLNLSACGLGRVQMFGVLPRCTIPIRLLQLSGNVVGQYWDAGGQTEGRLEKFLWNASGLQVVDLRRNSIKRAAAQRLTHKMSMPMRETGEYPGNIPTMCAYLSSLSLCVYVFECRV